MQPQMYSFTCCYHGTFVKIFHNNTRRHYYLSFRMPTKVPAGYFTNNTYCSLREAICAALNLICDTDGTLEDFIGLKALEQELDVLKKEGSKT